MIKRRKPWSAASFALAAAALLAVLSCEPEKTVPDNYLWRHDLGDPCASAPAREPSGSLLVVTYHGKLFRIGAPGTAAATATKIADLGDVFTNPPEIGSDGDIYAVSGNGHAWRLKGDGTVVWKFDSITRTCEDPVALSGSTAFVLYSRYNEIACLDRDTGALKRVTFLESFAKTERYSRYDRLNAIAMAGNGPFAAAVRDSSSYEAFVVFLGEDGTVRGSVIPPETPTDAAPDPNRETFSAAAMFPFGDTAFFLGEKAKYAEGAGEPVVTVVLRTYGPDGTPDDAQLEGIASVPFWSQGYDNVRVLGGNALQAALSYTDSSVTVKEWNLESANRGRSLGTRVIVRPGKPAISIPMGTPKGTIPFLTDSGEMWVWHENQEKFSLFAKFLSRWIGDTVEIGKDIQIPERPLVAPPLLVDGALVLAYADNWIQGYAAPTTGHVVSSRGAR